MAQIDEAIKINEEGDHEAAFDRVMSLRDKLKKLRKSGLEKNGEYSVENLAFKTLRNTGYLGKLADLKKEAYDAMMSIDEKRKVAMTVAQESQKENTMFGHQPMHQGRL